MRLCWMTIRGGRDWAYDVTILLCCLCIAMIPQWLMALPVLRCFVFARFCTCLFAFVRSAHSGEDVGWMDTVVLLPRPFALAPLVHSDERVD